MMSAPKNTSDRIITIPGLPWELRIYCDTIGDYDRARIALIDTSLDGGTVVAHGRGFGRPEHGAWTWLDAPRRDVIGTFIGFLDHAIESDEPDAREGWIVIDDEIVHNYTETLWLEGICE